MKQAQGSRKWALYAYERKQEMKYKKLNEAEKQEFFEKHLPHRLVLLRTFRERFSEASFSEGTNGDLHRCAKDACFLAIRMWVEFFCLKGKREGHAYRLEAVVPRYPDDVRIYSFLPDYHLNIDDVHDGDIIAKAYVIADKELAHLTSNFQGRSDDLELLARATEALEDLIRARLYEQCDRNVPTHELGESW